VENPALAGYPDLVYSCPSTMNQIFSLPRLLACLLVLAAAGAWAQGLESRDQLIQGMMRIVLEHNPTLASQAALLREAEKLPDLRARLALTGMSLSLATGFWDTDAGAFRLYPAATLGTTLSIADPARALSAYALKKEREGARQEYRRIQNALVADLLATVRELLKLFGRRESLSRLKAYLQDYSALIEKQVRAGAATPELDKLWELRERLLGIEAEIAELDNQLDTMRLEAALRLAGDSWQELLGLLSRLG